MSRTEASGESKNVKLQRKIASVVSGRFPLINDRPGHALPPWDSDTVRWQSPRLRPSKTSQYNCRISIRGSGELGAAAAGCDQDAAAGARCGSGARPGQECRHNSQGLVVCGGAQVPLLLPRATPSLCMNKRTLQGIGKGWGHRALSVLPGLVSDDTVSLSCRNFWRGSGKD